MVALNITAVLFAATNFDYLIAGGGTAGLTLAARLTEDPKIIVGVIEAGQDRSTDPKILTPGLVTSVWGDPDYDWTFTTTPQVCTVHLSCSFAARILSSRYCIEREIFCSPSRIWGLFFVKPLKFTFIRSVLLGPTILMSDHLMAFLSKWA